MRMAYIVPETEKSHDMPPESWKTSDVIEFQRNRSSDIQGQDKMDVPAQTER
jgi:hypothetical protein